MEYWETMTTLNAVSVLVYSFGSMVVGLIVLTILDIADAFERKADAKRWRKQRQNTFDKRWGLK